MVIGITVPIQKGIIPMSENAQAGGSKLNQRPPHHVKEINDEPNFKNSNHNIHIHYHRLRQYAKRPKRDGITRFKRII